MRVVRLNYAPDLQPHYLELAADRPNSSTLTCASPSLTTLFTGEWVPSDGVSCLAISIVQLFTTFLQYVVVLRLPLRRPSGSSHPDECRTGPTFALRYG